MRPVAVLEAPAFFKGNTCQVAVAATAPLTEKDVPLMVAILSPLESNQQRTITDVFRGYQDLSAEEQEQTILNIGGLGWVSEQYQLNTTNTDAHEFKAAAELFHRDVEAATGRKITDRCGCDKVRWWGGLKSPEHLLFVRPELVSYETPKLVERAQKDVVRENPYQYKAREVGQKTSESDMSPATIWIIHWIFKNILPPPDADAYNTLVTPAKAVTRLVSPQLDEAFCNWIAHSQYRMLKIGNDPLDFLYRGEAFDNASVGWFIRRVDENVPD